MTRPTPRRACWVWITRPEFYLDDEGNDHPDLEPNPALDHDLGWWTCHSETRSGDLALLYRTRPRSDIAYLLEATSEARPLEDPDSEFAGRYVCDWTPRHKLRPPLSLEAMKGDAFLAKEWGALRASFKGSHFRIPPSVWQRLTELVSARDPSFERVVRKMGRSRVSPDILNEKKIEDSLRDNLGRLRPRHDLKLYVDPDGRSGQQFPCPECRGFIDLLCVDRKTGGFVVIELKARRAGRNAAGQIKSYMGWVSANLPNRRRVRGLIIATGCDPKLSYALRDMPRVEFIDLGEVQPPLL